MRPRNWLVLSLLASGSAAILLAGRRRGQKRQSDPGVVAPADDAALSAARRPSLERPAGPGAPVGRVPGAQAADDLLQRSVAPAAPPPQEDRRRVVRDRSPAGEPHRSQEHRS